MAPKNSSNTNTNNSVEAMTTALFQGLRESSYACGGTIKIQLATPAGTDSVGYDVQESSDDGQDQAVVEPVTIRWDSATLIEKLVLPLTEKELNKRKAPIAKLVAGTQPASFGFKGKDVVDESYREASKLDPSAFSTNFCPYEAGIIDVIGQALLPKYPNSYQGIRAELYKLNIYEAPSGFFKPHVDTPRSEYQFGSLVVCLPCEHEGGQLIVRHQGRYTTFDWSGQSQDIMWAAFYSDCELEVLEVTARHRITLTYNLYMRRGLGELAGHSQMLNPEQLPVYNDVKAALANAKFMPKGGLLGKYCSHAYTHATSTAASALPSILKGSDMVAYEVFRALGIEVMIRPVAEHISKHLDGSDLEEDSELATHDRIGYELTEPINTGVEWGDYYDIREVYKEYPGTSEEVTWVNGPNGATKNVQFLYTIYGNQAESGYEYSYCALLFVIPPHSKRAQLAEKHGYKLK